MLIKEKTAKFITAILFIPLILLIFASESRLLSTTVAVSLIVLLITVVFILGVLSSNSASERIEISELTLTQDKDIYFQLFAALIFIGLISYRFSVTNSKAYLFLAIFILLAMVFKIWLRAKHKSL